MPNCEYKDPRCATTDECHCGAEPKRPKQKPFIINEGGIFDGVAMDEVAIEQEALRRALDRLDAQRLMGARIRTGTRIEPVPPLDAVFPAWRIRNDTNTANVPPDVENLFIGDTLVDEANDPRIVPEGPVDLEGLFDEDENDNPF